MRSETKAEREKTLTNIKDHLEASESEDLSRKGAIKAIRKEVRDEATDFVVTTSANSWGAGRDEQQALNAALERARVSRLDDSETVTIYLYEIEGDWKVNEHTGAVRGEEFLNENKLEMSVRNIKRIQDAIDEIENIKHHKPEVME